MSSDFAHHGVYSFIIICKKKKEPAFSSSARAARAARAFRPRRPIQD